MSSLQSVSTASTPEKKTIVFVTGASRSGTTMLNQILGNHSRILGLNELHYYGDLWDPGSDYKLADKQELERISAVLFARQARGIWGKGPIKHDYEEARNLVARLEPEQCTGTGLFAEVLAQMAADAGKEIVCEQTPRYIFYAEHILESFPGARIVHLIRDPRAVLASQKNRWQLKRRGTQNIPYSELIRAWFNYHPATMCRLWMKASEAALRLQEHPRFMILRFEDLVTAPEVSVRQLCDFLEIGFEPDMLEVPQWGSSNIQYEGEKKGISRDMLNKWEDVLTQGECVISESMTKRLMTRFSYEPKSPDQRHIIAFLPYIFRYPFHLAGVVLANPRRAWIQLKAMLQSGKKG